MTYFKNVKSYDDLKNQFRALLKANHPDNGGDAEAMKAINCEYDALFLIWKDRKEAETGAKVKETAESTRSEFYTQNGWEGSRHDWSRSLKEVAQIVRAYVKEKYPTCKFSVRTSYASMCQELHIELKEFPEQMYKTGDDLRAEGLTHTVTRTLYTTGEAYSYQEYTEEVSEMLRKLNYNNMFNKDSWTDGELIEAYEKATANSNFYAIKTEYFRSVLEDVDALVNSYNYEDCDGQIDYFHVDFYYFGCKFSSCKHVPKTARIKKQASAPAKRSCKKQEPKQEAPAPEQIEQKTGYTYKITRGEDTRDGSDLWIVRIIETLDKAAYIAENKAMQARGGYYSKFRHGFLFRFDPAEVLKTA